jgi:hypothetical protein
MPGRNSFANIPAGVAGMETMTPVAFSEGARNGHLSLNQFVKLTSMNSARLFGLSPKGHDRRRLRRRSSDQPKHRRPSNPTLGRLSAMVCGAGRILEGRFYGDADDRV